MLTHFTALLLMALASDPTPAPPPNQPSPAQQSSPTKSSPQSSALERFSPEAQAIIKRRAQFVFFLPGGAIYDAFQYVEFRKVLDEYDTRKPGSSVSARPRAWGFTDKNSFPSHDNRPKPLWHTLSPGTGPYTPFIYVNTDLSARTNRGQDAMLTLGKELAESLFTFKFREYPGSENDSMRMPCSINLGYATGIVRITRDQQPQAGQPRTGEFFLLPDPEITESLRSVTNAPPGATGFRFVHARELRMTAESYAKALLEGRAELVEWSFRRETSRFGDTFTWTSSKLPIPEASAAQP